MNHTFVSRVKETLKIVRNTYIFDKLIALALFNWLETDQLATQETWEEFN